VISLFFNDEECNVLLEHHPLNNKHNLH